jgi:hypothetical protein
MSTLIRVRGRNIQAEMMADFERERGEMKRLLVLGNEVQKERARSRLEVIEGSVEELKKQIADPTRYAKLVAGGYDNDEINRFQQKFEGALPRVRDKQ